MRNPSVPQYVACLVVGLVVVAGLGCLIYFTPDDTKGKAQTAKIPELTYFSTTVGWIYFALWTVSFYPQIFENWQRQSVVGLDFNFLTLNTVGFSIYSLYNCLMYFDPEIRKQYFAKHPGGVEPVQLNDIVFSIHAVFACVATVIQCFIYERGGQRVSYLCFGILACFGIYTITLAGLGGGAVISWFDVLNFASYMKLATTLIKCIPQAVFNFRRKSTVGWSIGNVLLDFTGGWLSMMQIFIIAYNFDDWQSIFGDFTKFGLGLFSVLFDVLFILQHYVFYPKREEEVSVDTVINGEAGALGKKD